MKMYLVTICTLICTEDVLVFVFCLTVHVAAHGFFLWRKQTKKINNKKMNYLKIFQKHFSNAKLAAPVPYSAVDQEVEQLVQSLDHLCFTKVSLGKTLKLLPGVHAASV